MTEAKFYDVQVSMVGILKGHTDWVTSIICGYPQQQNDDCSFLISSSRDKRIIIWQLYEKEQNGLFGVPEKTINNSHNHFISDLSLSQDNTFVISSSWDQTLLVWDLSIGKVWSNCVGHQSEVYSVCFSPDNRQIISAGSDRKIKLWNVHGQCKFSSQDDDSHTGWISCIRYSPKAKFNLDKDDQPILSYFASVGWDGLLKIWETNLQLRLSIRAHESQINSLSISKNSKFIATGGQDKNLCIWNIFDLSSPVRQYDVGSHINIIVFNPKIQWVAVGTNQGFQIFNLLTKSNDPCFTVKSESITNNVEESKNLYCTSLDWNWSTDQGRLFAGFTDGIIRVYSFSCKEEQI